MTKESMIEFIEQRKEDLLKSSSQESQELLFYRDFFDGITTSSLQDVLSFDEKEFVIASLSSRIHDKSFFDISSDVDSISSLFLHFPSSNFKLLDSTVRSILEEKDQSSSASVFHANVLTLMQLLKDNHCSDCDICKLLEYYGKYPEAFMETLVVVSVLKNLKRDYASFQDALSDFESINNCKVRKKNQKKIFQEVIKTDYNLDSIYRFVVAIRHYYDELEKKQESQQKKNNRQIKSYDEFLNSYDAMFQQEEIKNYEDFLKNIPDQEIRLFFLKQVYNHNSAYYHKIQEEYESLAKNSVNHFLALLQEYGISKDEVSLPQVMRNSYDDVFSMLQMMEGISNNKKCIIFAIEYSNLLRISHLKEYIHKGILSKNTIEKYRSLFLENSIEFSNLLTSLSILDSYNFNATNFISCPDILFHNPFLKENFHVLEEYHLLSSLKGKSDYSFLGREHLSILIDQILELGLEDYLVEDLSLLNEEHWNRIQLLKSMGISISSKEELYSILTKDSFFVPDSLIESYIPNDVSYYQKNNSGDFCECPSSFDVYSTSNRCYKIGGVTLSKNRVKRHFNGNFDSKEESFFQAILSESILSDEDIQNIRDEIFGKVDKK